MYKDDQLTALCAEWQKRLRLQDWDVEAVYAKYYEIQCKDADGECDYIFGRKEAQIRILCPEDCREQTDAEEILVHELLHLHFAGWTERYDDCPASGEQAIEIVARALVSLKREAMKS